MTKQLFLAAGTALAACTLGALHVAAQGAAAAPAAHQSGIFFVMSDGTAETPIKGSLAQQKTKGIGKSILTQGFSKPSLELHLNGAASDVHVASGDVTFYFYFPPAVDSKNPPPPDPMAFMAGMNGMYSTLPAQAKGPSDFALLRLQASDSERVADMGKSPGDKPKDPIPFLSEKIGDLAFKVKTKEALAPGEYGFNFVGMHSAGGQVWDFGVTVK